MSKALTTVAKDGMEVASIAAKGNPAFSAVSQGMSAVMSYDLFGLVDIRNTVGKKDAARRFVLVFDDLERSNLPKKDLLGTLNELIENKQIKVIIVADEEKINSEEYNEYKEKIVSRTIRMSTDYQSLIGNIVESYSETSEGYKQFLIDNLALLEQVFTESGSNNPRSLKTAIADFERIYAAWKETEIAIDNMKWALYTFTAEIFISKAPPIKESEKAKRNTSTLFAPEGEKQYVYKGKQHSFFSSFTAWIRSGTWDKSFFVQELQKKYSKAELTPLERFLFYRLWSLEQKDIDDGLPSALELAYSGQLSRDNLIDLLIKVHQLHENSIELPCSIHYKQIEDGFKKRIASIKRGEITEPKCHTFATREQIDSEAYKIYKMIENLEDLLLAWENRKRFIDYICGEVESSGYFRKGYYVDEFDDELLTVFKERYSVATNEQKWEYAGSLLRLVFDYTCCSTKDNLLVSKKNFNELISWLDSQGNNDAITTIINNSFVKHIQEHSIMKDNS